MAHFVTPVCVQWLATPCNTVIGCASQGVILGDFPYLTWGYSHSIIKKCSAFTISPLIYSWLFLIVRRIDFDSPSKKLISNSVASRIIVERVFGLSFNGKRICRATCQASLFPTRWRFLSEQGFSERRAASDGMLAGADHLSVILLETQKECFSCSRRLFHYSCANSQCFWDGATWIGRYGPPSL